VSEAPGLRELRSNLAGRERFLHSQLLREISHSRAWEHTVSETIRAFGAKATDRFENLSH